jgi:hypothetical protein
LLLLSLTTCKKENLLDCFKPNGKEITELRLPGSFSKIEVFDKVFVNVYKGSDHKVEVTAGKNIIKNVRTRIKDNVLIIENNNTCNFVRGYKREIVVNVTVPYMRKITNSGVATIRMEQNFVQDTLELRVQNSGDVYINGTFNEVRTSSHGNGDIYLSGSANSFYIYTHGTNFVKAEDLVVKDFTFVETISIGDCYINATQLNRLDYHIHASGDIFYSGTPAYITDYKGEGTGKAIPK